MDRGLRTGLVTIAVLGALGACGSNDSTRQGAADGSAGESGVVTDATTTMESGAEASGPTETDGGATSPVDATAPADANEAAAPCSAARTCGAACCAAGEVCSFGACVTPGSTCHGPTDCPAGSFCDPSLGNAAAEAGCSASGECIPQPPACAPDAGIPDGSAITCLGACQYHPSGPFNPVVNDSWGGQVTSPFDTDVMMVPIVVQLDDDDCDGKVTARDIPEIVFSTFSLGAYGTNGVLHAISILGGQVVDKWSVSGVVNPTKQIAGGNIDGMPGNEIVACGVDGAVHAFRGDGTPIWTSAAMTCFMPQIADLDGDGVVEVVVEGGILDGSTGTLKHAYSSPLDGPPVVSDIDGDGQLDVVTASRGYHADGTLFVDTGLDATSLYGGTQDWRASWPAVADFDKDGRPEIVVVDNINHVLAIWRYDASQAQKFDVVRAPVDINSSFSTNTCTGWGATHGGGPPVLADLDGDGVVDVGTASGIGYVAFSGAKLIDATVAGPSTVLWSQPTHDCSSASTGSAAFDFNGDGIAEVVYADEYYLRIYDGVNGDILFQTCNTTATLIEYPVVADVDGDGHADLVVASNAYGSTCPADGSRQAGIRVFGDANHTWVRTRAVWNEHPYHVTNVNDDGTIPQHEAPNFTQPGLDDFRQNALPGGDVFAAPDLVVSIAPVCTASSYALVATVRNVGEAMAPAGVVVGVYEGAAPGTKLGTLTTATPLYSAEGEELVLALSSPDPNVVNGTTPVYAVVDDGATPHPSWTECRTNNDTSPPTSGVCSP